MTPIDTSESERLLEVVNSKQGKEKDAAVSALRDAQDAENAAYVAKYGHPHSHADDVEVEWLDLKCSTCGLEQNIAVPVDFPGGKIKWECSYGGEAVHVNSVDHKLPGSAEADVDADAVVKSGESVGVAERVGTGG